MIEEPGRKQRITRACGGILVAGLLCVGASAAAVAPAVAQDPAEAVMVVAGAWAAERLPGGVARVDAHRSGAGLDGARLERVAGALGASLARLEDVRQCTDVMDPASCEFTGGPIIAISQPRIDGDQASVQVYAWHGTDSSRRPVTKRSWTLELRQAAGEWRVVSGG